MAGGIPEPGEPLYPLAQGKPKALLPIGGRPMVQWVLDALSKSKSVERIVVVGLGEGDGPLTARQPLSYVPNQGSMIGNVEGGVKRVVELNPAAQYTLLASCDIPAVTGEMVDWVVETSLATEHDLYYSIVTQAAMEARFPGSKRSFFRLKEGRFSGGDMNVLRTEVVSHLHPAWQGIVAARKSALKQARLIGLDTLALFAAGLLSIPEAERRAGRALNIKGRVLRCPYAEVAMDVDKPHQYELLKRDLERSPLARMG